MQMERQLLHDIRNKITALESQLFMLKRNTDEGNETAQKYLIRMEETIVALKEQLAHLHDIAKAAN